MKEFKKLKLKVKLISLISVWLISFQLVPTIDSGQSFNRNNNYNSYRNSIKNLSYIYRNSKLLEFYNKSPIPYTSCTGSLQQSQILKNNNNGTTIPPNTGKCMFIYECFKDNGTSLGICHLDKNLFGTCCYINKTVENSPDYDTNSKIVVAPETTGSSSSESESEEPPTPPPHSLYSKSCGKSMFKSGLLKAQRQKSDAFRIVGGESSSLGLWPWVVSIRRASLFGYSSTHTCGGVLISNNWVLTAGHCIGSLSKSLIRVRMGDYDFQNDNEESPFIERKIEKKILNPYYNYTTFENDIALLKLLKPIQFTPTISPLCLPLTPEWSKLDLSGSNATVIGWGRLAENGLYSQKQLFVQVPVLNNSQCVDMFKVTGRDEKIPDTFVCAGYAIGGKDGCQGDSGGPLQVLGDDGRWVLVGIMSWGIGCGEPNQPGVYTRITKFTDWIVENTKSSPTPGKLG